MQQGNLCTSGGVNGLCFSSSRKICHGADGELSDGPAATALANELREDGASIYCVGVGDARVAQLAAVAGSSSRVFFAQNFNVLTNLIGSIVNQSCVEILATSPAAQSTVSVTLMSCPRLRSPFVAFHIAIEICERVSSRFVLEVLPILMFMDRVSQKQTTRVKCTAYSALMAHLAK